MHLISGAVALTCRAQLPLRSSGPFLRGGEAFGGRAARVAVWRFAERRPPERKPVTQSTMISKAAMASPEPEPGR